MMSTTAAKPATTPIPVQLSAPEFETFITGCKFSVAQMLRSSAQREGNRIRRERCAKKNAWDSEPA
jgi:hypothetical protein